MRVGIIGFGRIGRRHFEVAQSLVEIVAVCDINRDAMEEYFSNSINSPQIFYDIDSFLKNGPYDIVSICTPNGLHAEHSIKSLKAGNNVLCEKPMALSSHDCGLMIHEAERANKRLFIVKQNRFNPPIQALKKIIDEGRLGKIYNVHLGCFWNRNDAYYSGWKGSLDMDGGTLFTQFSHFIDLLYWLIGDVRKVEAYGQNFNHGNVIDFEDSGVVVLEFHNGSIGTINYSVNSFSKNMEGSLTIIAENGSIKIGGQYLNELEYQCIKDYKISDLPQGNLPNNYGTYVGSMSNHKEVYENIISVLKDNSSVMTNMFEGLKTTEIIEKIYNRIRK